MATRRKTPPSHQPSPDAANPAQQAGELGMQLAATRSEQIGADLADRYAAIGARWLADALPTRLDNDLIERLAGQGFRRDRLADIRVHRGSRAQAAADALDARAFAVGDGDVFFAPGQYDPSTPEGRAVIAHEVAHVAPPSHAGAGAAAMPVLNERRRRDGASDGEAEERVARQAEARVFAEESRGGAPEMAASPVAANAPAARAAAKRIDPHVLESKVLAILERMQRTEGERSGSF